MYSTDTKTEGEAPRHPAQPPEAARPHAPGPPQPVDGLAHPMRTLRALRPEVRRRLSETLTQNTDAIVQHWVSTVREDPDSVYARLEWADVENSVRTLFAAYVRFLFDGDAESLTGAVLETARRRLQQGFPLVDLAESVGAIRVTVLPVVIAAMVGEPDLLTEVVGALMAAEGLAAVTIAQAYQEATTTELRLAHEQTLRAEQDKVAFCREMARVATHGKLILCDHEEVPPRPDAEGLEVASPQDIRTARRMAAKHALAMNWPEAKTYALQLCIGESGTNAIRHANGAAFQVWPEGDDITFRLADHGPGIEFTRIPAALQPGFSTKSSLGMGFTLMLELASVLKLATDARGTTMQLTLSSGKVLTPAA